MNTPEMSGQHSQPLQPRYAVGRVLSRSDGSVVLLSEKRVHVSECPCDDGRFVLLELVGYEFQPRWWEV
jgi:hypothetical protein